MKSEMFNCNLSFDGFTEVKSGYYVSSSTFNGLLYISKETNTIEYINGFEGEYPYKDTLHHKQYFYRDKIFFLPDHSKHIHIYDINEKKFDSVSFGHIQGCEDPIRGVDSFRIQNYIWIFFAYAHNPIMKFNMDTCEIEETHYIFNMLPKEIATRKGPVFFTPFCLCEGKVYGAIWKSSYIFEFEILTASKKLIQVKDNVMISGVAVTREGDIYYTIINDTKIGRYNLYNQKKNYYRMSDEPEIFGKELVYAEIIPVKDYILLISNITDDIYKLSENCVIPYLKFPLGYAHNTDKRASWRRYYSWIVENDKIIMTPFGCNMAIEIDVICDEVKGIVISMTHNEKMNIYRSLEKELLYRKFGEICKENRKLSLVDYLQYVVNE